MVPHGQRRVAHHLQRALPGPLRVSGIPQRASGVDLDSPTKGLVRNVTWSCTTSACSEDAPLSPPGISAETRLR
eukprot:12140351-Alexandrium_andersonii.AAC.1